MIPTPRIVASYSFWSHPIKWMRERKMRRIMQMMVDAKYPAMHEEMKGAIRDAMIYGYGFYHKKP